MADVLTEHGLTHISYPGAGAGFAPLLEEYAARCTHTNIMALPDFARHQRILFAVAKSPRFQVVGYRQGRTLKGQRLLRVFGLAGE